MRSILGSLGFDLIDEREAMRVYVYRLLEAEEEGADARLVRGLLSAVIAINVTAAMISTMPELESYRATFAAIERASVLVFVAEYVLRLWCVGERVDRPIVGRLKYAATPLMIIDLAAIVPFFIPGSLDLTFMRAFRLIRLMKVVRHSEALSLILKVLTDKRRELMSTMSLTGILLIVFSSLMYYAEHPGQPETFPSIPATMWWGIASISPMSYGEMVPLTTAGRFVGAVVAILGIGLFALPAGILGSGFVEALNDEPDDGKPAP